MNNTNKLLLLASILTLNSSLYAATFKAKVYDKDATSPMFTYVHTERSEGGKRIVEAQFHTMDGKLALHEKLHYTPGKNIFDLYELSRPLSHERAAVKPDGEKLHFSYHDGPKHEDDKESIEENTISREDLNAFVAKNWQTIMSGDKLKSRFVIADRTETIGFSMRKREEVTYKGKPAVRVILFATSPFVAAIAGDTFLTFERDGAHRLLEVDGRTPVLKQVDGKWKSFVGRMEYEYEAPVPTLASNTKR